MEGTQAAHTKHERLKQSGLLPHLHKFCDPKQSYNHHHACGWVFGVRHRESGCRLCQAHMLRRCAIKLFTWSLHKPCDVGSYAAVSCNTMSYLFMSSPLAHHRLQHLRKNTLISHPA